MRYRDLSSLLAAELTTEEAPHTAALIRDLRGARKRGYLTKAELLDICMWKSPRAMKLCRSNPAPRVRSLSAKAFCSRSERVRLDALTSLRGVGIPMASAILTLTDPRRYGVIDIRVWQVLFELRSVRTKPKGVGFGFNNWYHYLQKLRYHANSLGVSARSIEYTLFLYHQKRQRGLLYG